MWNITKILVPTDFSRASEVALEAAVSLATKFDASIVLLHTYQLPIYPYATGALVAPAELVMRIDQGAEKALHTAASAHAQSGVQITTALQAGIPWEQILRGARKFEVDLIVMGSRGLRGLPRALLGSTAERVVRYSTVPVITLHGPVESERSTGDTIKAANDVMNRWHI